MFTKSARFYDAIYSFKDYATEASRVRDIVATRVPEARTLLDVACGTGLHLQHLRKWFECEGIDLDPGLLELAREKLGNGFPLHEGDMRDFDLAKAFDAVTCLFSAIGYVRSEDELQSAITRMTAHLVPGGVLVVEPWLGPDEFVSGHLGGVFVDKPELKIARMNVGEVEGRISRMLFHYLVGTAGEISYFDELHETYLFSNEEYRAAFEIAGLEVQHDPEGLMGRGLWIGVKPG